MRVPLSWLKDYLEFDLTNDELADVLTLAGLEVDKVEETTFSFTNVVVAEVKETKPHPNADKLTVATVFDGTETLQVVCGDPNCSAGIKTALARIGGSLTDETGKVWKIKKSKLRDVESFGMLCTEKELGLSDDHSTIMRFSEETPLGTDVSSLYSDTLFEISLTPNLGHCMSMLGIARDLAALLNLKAKRPPLSLQESGSATKESIQVKIEDTESCYRYSCRLIKNIQVGPSPDWLKNRLESAGIRSLNNIVDVTNYVMLELGQPLHAFDYEKVRGKTIHVQFASQDQTFETLDEKKRTVPAGTLLICDDQGPLAIAGVMGGAESEVKEQTKHILLESAHFNPSAVRKASKQQNLRSESSARFERGVDPAGVDIALDRAASLIAQIAGGDVASGSVEAIAKPFKPRTLKCRISRTNQILGTTLSFSEVESFFRRLEMEVKTLDEDTLQVTVPSYRNDIHSEIDLIEEAARVFGYNNIEKKNTKVINSKLPHTPLYLMEDTARKKLIAEGLQEFLTCDLISPELSKLSLEKSLSSQDEITVLHPSSVDQSILRTSFLPGLLQTVKNNFDKQNFNIAAFEIGRVHFKNENQFKERSTAAIILTGNAAPHHWSGNTKEVNFFDLKGILENFLESFRVPDLQFSFSNLKSFHPGKQADLLCGSVKLGVAGEVHPQRLLKLGIEGRVFFAQLDLHDLLEVSIKQHKMAPLPLYPGSDRDWTITVRKDLSLADIMDAIKSTKSKLLKQSYILDLYESEKLGPDRQNVTLRFVYRDDRQTIEQKTVEKEHPRILDNDTKKIASHLIHPS